MKKKVALIILDGWGIEPDPNISAIAAAKTPTMDRLQMTCPNAKLVTFGESVGLPEGQMGNSEVGHINLGAGRIVYQELARINKAIRENALLENEVFMSAINYARSNNKSIHLLGLLSDGGVHAHVDHIKGVIDILKAEVKNTNVYIHAFLDGRDTDPKSGINHVKTFIGHIENTNVQFSTIIGRYYAMDRDKRWERVKKAYDLLVHGVGTVTANLEATIQEFYDAGITDEFMPPIVNGTLQSNGRIQEDDVVIFCNFRTDRPRQLTEVLTQYPIEGYQMFPLRLHYVTFTKYDDAYENIHVIFSKENVTNTLGQIISQEGLKQVRIAETEKYPHVTFFFNGGVESKYDGEERILIPSPKVATYDLQPEMSAHEITNSLIDYIEKEAPDFICLNYANADMVGHTGDFAAAIKAAETVDTCLDRLLTVLKDHDYDSIIIADHGNSDLMVNPDGSPNTAHTTNLVPLIFVSYDTDHNYTVRDGKLGDIAPTILSIMDISVPCEMTGDIIINKNQN